MTTATVGTETTGKANRQKSLAERGVDAAAKHLTRKGLEIIERNWVSPQGTIDIVARDDQTLVFVDVRTRLASCEGFPTDCVTEAVRDRRERAALAYLRSCFDEVDVPVRFDTISILALGGDRGFLKHHINAMSQV